MDFSLKTLDDMTRDKRGNRRRKFNTFLTYAERDNFGDIKSRIMNDVRAIFNLEPNTTQLNMEEIYQKLVKKNPGSYGNMRNLHNKDNVFETLNEYKKLQVLYIDDEQNVIFL